MPFGSAVWKGICLPPVKCGRLGLWRYSLPGRHWKWRMHSAALTMVERMKASGMLDVPVDLFLVTDMLDVGQFRAALPPELRGVPIALYFHENQLTFPDHPERPPEAWDRHYAFLNLTSALLADVVWFNSEYHRKVFLDAIPDFLRQLPSPRPVQPELTIQSKSEVLPIGLEADVFNPRPRGRFEDGPPVIVGTTVGSTTRARCVFESAPAGPGPGVPFRWPSWVRHSIPASGL